MVGEQTLCVGMGNLMDWEGMGRGIGKKGGVLGEEYSWGVREPKKILKLDWSQSRVCC